MALLNWHCKKLTTLTTLQLYDIIAVRNEVFVVEQDCVYNDADGKDVDAYHLFAYENNKIAAYARLLAPNVAFTEASIGRVLTAKDVRKMGYGIKLIQKAVEQTISLYGEHDIKIGAQLYLKKFYESFGFKQTSQMYLEDGIEHIEMLLSV